MSQANHALITTRAPATTPAAPSQQTGRSTVPGGIHRETILRQPPARRQLASEIRGFHAHLIARLAAVPPNMIDPFLQPDQHDLQLRADHLRIVLHATADYVGAFMRDAAYFSHAVQIERKYLDRLLDDVIGDLCGAIENAADRVREERAEGEG
jgi:hypothetical protein